MSFVLGIEEIGQLDAPREAKSVHCSVLVREYFVVCRASHALEPNGLLATTLSISIHSILLSS